MNLRFLCSGPRESPRPRGDIPIFSDQVEKINHHRNGCHQRRDFRSLLQPDDLATAANARGATGEPELVRGRSRKSSIFNAEKAAHSAEPVYRTCVFCSAKKPLNKNSDLRHSLCGAITKRDKKGRPSGRPQNHLAWIILGQFFLA